MGEPHRLGLIGGLICAGLSGIVLVGWAGDMPGLRSLWPGGPAMQPVTALCLGAGAMALMLRANGRAGVMPTVLGLLPLLLAALSLGAYLTGAALPTDRMLFEEAVTAQGSGGRVPGRMALGTALGLLPIAAGIALAGRAAGRRALPWLVGPGLLPPTLAALTFLFGLDDLEGFGIVTDIAAPTALGLLLLGTGALTLAIDEGWLRALHGPGVGARTARALLPWALTGPPVVAGVLHLGVEAGLYPADFRMLLVVTLSALALTVGVLRHAAQTDRSDALLRASEGLFRSVTDALPGFVFIADAEGRNSFLNRGYVEFTGQSAEEARGNGWLRTLHPDDRERAARTWSAAVASGQVYEAEYRFRRNDGACRWFVIRGTPVRDGDGRIARWVGTGTDIEDRKAAELQVLAERDRAESYLRAAQVMILALDADGRIATINPAGAAILGRTDEAALIGRDWFTLAIPADRQDEIRALFARYITGDSAAPEWQEGTVLRADGTERLVVWRNGVLRDRDGRIIGTLSSGADVTERRAVDEMLRRVVDEAPFPVMVHAEDGSILRLSRSWLDLTGYRADEIGSVDDWLRRAYPDRVETVARVLATLFDLDRPRSGGDVALRAADGRILHWSFRSAPVGRDPQGRRTMVSMAADLTARREAEARLHLLMREVDHRAKNVLAVVQAVVRLSQADDPESFAEAVEGRITAMARAHSLLAASGWTGVALHRLAGDELAAWREDGGSRVAVEGPPVLIQAEAAQAVTLALHELATNAAKYGALSLPTGRLTVAWRVTDGDGMLRLDWVERGGPPVSGAPTRRGFGSNLLELTVANQLGGRLERAWEPEGLTCSIALPTECWSRAVVPDSGDSTPSGRTDALAARSRTVLIAEDEPLTAMMLQRQLEAAGYVVLGPAARVPEALVLIGRRRPDAAVLDARLFDAFVTPVAAALDAMGVPFLLCSGYSSMSGLPSDLKGTKLLTKPVEPGILVGAVDALLTGAGQQRAG